MGYCVIISFRRFFTDLFYLYLIITFIDQNKWEQFTFKPYPFYSSISLPSELQVKPPSTMGFDTRRAPSISIYIVRGFRG